LFVWCRASSRHVHQPLVWPLPALPGRGSLSPRLPLLFFWRGSLFFGLGYAGDASAHDDGFAFEGKWLLANSRSCPGSGSWEPGSARSCHAVNRPTALCPCGVHRWRSRHASSVPGSRLFSGRVPRGHASSGYREVT
jgi:hypothetical protein